jgi:hypothetical protein
VGAVSRVLISDDLLHLGSVVAEEFKSRLVDEIAPALAKHWKGEIEELDVIDTGRYLAGVAPDEQSSSGDVTTIVIESKPASGYAAAIKRGHKGNYDYVGQRVAEQAIERADAEIRAALDGAGKRIE